MKLKVLKLSGGTNVAINPGAISSMCEAYELSSPDTKVWYTKVFMIGDPPEIYFKLNGRLNKNVLGFLE